MALTIKAKFTAADVAKIMKERVSKIENAILTTLQYVGESFVKNARENGTYTDRTGNLRSSIGYVILKDGHQLYDNFQKSLKGKRKKEKGAEAIIDGETGKARAAEVAKEIAAQHPKGFVLIVVAGMDYAAAVESKNYDVLTASSITAANDLKKSLEDISNKIGKMR